MIQEDGNHEDRLRKYLWSNSRALSSLRCLKVEKLFDLQEYDIEHIGYEEGLLINGVFVVTHGDMIRAHAGYTARGMFDKHGGCGMCGHSHRWGSSPKTNRFGVWGWWENGCLCSLHPDWKQNPDWQQAFSLVHFTKSRFWVEQIQVINRRFMYGGKVWGSGGKKRK